jgi:hypothetical protein
MEKISGQLLYQRMRNRVIELLDLYSSLEDVAKFGAFEVLEMVDDWLPLDYEKGPQVFSVSEQDVISSFLKLKETASDCTVNDVWDVRWFEKSEEWSNISKFAMQSHALFMVRGRFSEEKEQDTLV